MVEDKGTIEIVVAERDNRGPTGKIHSKEFNKGDAAAYWYDKQRFHSIEKEFSELHNDVPVIKHVKEKRRGL